MNEADSLIERLKAMGIEPEWRLGERPTNMEMLIVALTELGGAAHVDAIRERYRRIRTTRRPDLAWMSEEQITGIVKVTLRRNEVGNQSSDVPEERRCFINCEVGLGYWKLAPGVRYDKEGG